MTRARKGTGVVIGAAIAATTLALAVGSVMTGDVHMSLAGLDVSVQNHAERGLVVQVDGADCPGKGCPAFALDWKLARQG